MSLSLADRLLNAAPTLIALALAAAAFWFRTTAAAAADTKLREVLKDTVNPIADKLEKKIDALSTAIGTLTTTLAVEQQKHLDLQSRFDRAHI